MERPTEKAKKEYSASVCDKNMELKKTVRYDIKYKETKVLS